MLVWDILISLAVGAVGVQAFSHEHSHAQFHRRQNTTTDPASEFDYVVVGSGAGGAPVAARLALAGYSVLVLEAGEDMGDSIYTNVPALHFVAAEHPPMAWNYYVNHYPDLDTQRRDSKMEWRTPEGEIWVQLLNGTNPPEGSEPLGILYPRSGTVGGCGQHNAQIMVYPHPNDFQYIVDHTGDESWSPNNMRKYFERVEKVEYLPNSIAGHGYDGWLATSLTDLTLIVQDLKVASLVLSAAAAMGKGLLTSLVTTVTGLATTLALDLNNPSSSRDRVEAMYQVPLSINAADKTRSGPRNFLYSVADAVNADGSKKHKLTVQTTSLATKILFDTTSGEQPIATGVQYLRGKSLYRADPRSSLSGSPGTPFTAVAKREVIVSAGTFNTPQLLKLSGIGARSEIERFGIHVVVDSPGVGKNMQDRYEIPVIAKTDSDFALTQDCTFQTSQPDKCLDLYNNPGLLGKGVYGTSGAAFAVLQSASTDPPADPPSLFMSGWPANFVGYFDGYSTFALTEKKFWSWLSLKSHARNRAGTVELRSTDPRDTPVVNFNYFQQGAEEDMQALVEGVEFSRRAFDKLIPLDGEFEEVQPGLDVNGEALRQYIRDEAWGHHACCSAPIGGQDEEGAVLDSKFRVKGVKGLRVVDASVFPVIPGYFVAVPIYMVAEKAAEDILAAAADEGESTR